jgi:toxin YoeB
MSFVLQFTEKTDVDIIFHKKSGNLGVISKIKKLLAEIAEHPFTGTGKPEELKHNLSGKWSRRINKEHRIVYEKEGDIIKILSARGHYK